MDGWAGYYDDGADYAGHTGDQDDLTAEACKALCDNDAYQSFSHQKFPGCWCTVSLPCPTLFYAGKSEQGAKYKSKCRPPGGGRGRVRYADTERGVGWALGSKGVKEFSR